MSDMITNLRFRGYNLEQLRADQYACSELHTAIAFMRGEYMDDPNTQMDIDKATEFYIMNVNSQTESLPLHMKDIRKLSYLYDIGRIYCERCTTLQ